MPITPAPVVAQQIMSDLGNHDGLSLAAMTTIVGRILDAVRAGQVTITPLSAAVTCGTPLSVVPVVGGTGTIA